MIYFSSYLQNFVTSKMRNGAIELLICCIDQFLSVELGQFRVFLMIVEFRHRLNSLEKPSDSLLLSTRQTQILAGVLKVIVVHLI